MNRPADPSLLPGPFPGAWRLAEGPSPAVLSRPGALDSLGEVARAYGFARPLVTGDSGIADAGILDRALRILAEAGIRAAAFTDFGENPSESEVERGRVAARRAGADSLIGLGGGSSLDVAKGVGFLLAGGGRMEDYRGYDRVGAPLPPMIGAPTTAGTGSEAQSYALISRDRDHRKLACGAPSALFRAVIHDPALLPSAPLGVRAAAGFDALAHAVETAVSTGRTDASAALSRSAFALLVSSFPKVVRAGGAENGFPSAGAANEEPDDSSCWARMQRGAFFAGAAIERSMLGAAHALANPLTRNYGLSHGRALARTLPAVVRWNAHAEEARAAYAGLLAAGAVARNGESAGVPKGGSREEGAGDALAARIEEAAASGGLLEGDLREDGDRLSESAVDALAAEAAEEWTGRFNPRPFTEESARMLYRSALG